MAINAEARVPDGEVETSGHLAKLKEALERIKIKAINGMINGLNSRLMEDGESSMSNTDPLNPASVMLLDGGLKLVVATGEALDSNGDTSRDTIIFAERQSRSERFVVVSATRSSSDNYGETPEIVWSPDGTESGEGLLPLSDVLAETRFAHRQLRYKTHV